MSLTSLGMWADWQNKVIASVQNFCANPIYVEQNSVSLAKFNEVARVVLAIGPVDGGGKTRDAEFGGRVVETGLGPVTRMWLEGNVEIDFLRRSIPNLAKFRVFDIGAGYGRLAVMLAPLVARCVCTDAVPISTTLCRQYCARFAGNRVDVWSIEETQQRVADGMMHGRFDLAINIHSWNECTLSQIDDWLAMIVTAEIPFLFTVSHGQMNHSPEPSYRSWDGKPWRPLLERYFTLVREESLGLSPNPHALWMLK